MPEEAGRLDARRTGEASDSEGIEAFLFEHASGGSSRSPRCRGALPSLGVRDRVLAPRACGCVEHGTECGMNSVMGVPQMGDIADVVASSRLKASRAGRSNAPAVTIGVKNETSYADLVRSDCGWHADRWT